MDGTGVREHADPFANFATSRSLAGTMEMPRSGQAFGRRFVKIPRLACCGINSRLLAKRVAALCLAVIAVEATIDVRKGNGSIRATRGKIGIGPN